MSSSLVNGYGGTSQHACPCEYRQEQQNAKATADTEDPEQRPQQEKSGTEGEKVWTEPGPGKLHEETVPVFRQEVKCSLIGRPSASSGVLVRCQREQRGQG